MTDSTSVVDDFLNGECLRALAVGAGDRVLDVGCGFGVFSADVAAIAASVVGVELADPVVTAARRAAQGRGLADRIEFRTGDALRLPLCDDEWGTFDIVHARFLLESLRDPGAAVAQMLRAVRPGGRVVLTDDDHEALRLWPEAPRVMAAWAAYRAFFDAGGNDAIVGRKLVALLHDAGATPVRAATLSFGTSAGEPGFLAGVARLGSILETERAGILATGRVDAAGLDAALDEWTAWSLHPAAAAWNVVRSAEGHRPD
jgi:SAM-dependent methyltransferase